MRLLLLTTMLMIGFACDGPTATNLWAEPLRPNVVLIFVDDLGYGDLGCYGNAKIKTPHLDRLASSGQRWTSFYSSGSYCVPSRKGLMSGRHPNFIPNRVDGLRDDPQALLPAMFKRAGYATAMFGKWHLAGYPKDFTQHPMHPLECGFDDHLGTPGSNDVPAPKGQKQTRDLFDRCDKYTFPVPLIRGREVIEFPANQELFTQRYTAESIRWIQSHRDEPFFVYLAHNMPHAPVFASPEFQGKSAGGRFGDVVEEIDWSVGELMKTLAALNLREKTLVVFTSDNGPWTVFGPHGGTAAPLRGEKGTTWEGGLRVPAIFSWPETIRPATIDGIAANLDLYATFANLVGGDQPSKKPGYDSKDLSPTLLDGQPSPRSSWAYHTTAFRSGRYKIHTTIVPPADPISRRRQPRTVLDQPQLYDLINDLGETVDIAAERPEVVQRLLDEKKRFEEREAR
ncbi:sulfatase-like hydrolase/transferase [Roseiconus lacunae]|uniref:Sulfatase-like hydrolase/transferase n=2 Tax=Roseiconus lacunae TaxID=2605694 RepID=A0ABT7PRW3_9BACT|nr:sulfatase-like hydrolase/transferase [Roseiconus lacunae]MDM4019237.1 sulfatase-like hydrolase/transferase [Roseiconus lacunae]